MNSDFETMELGADALSALLSAERTETLTKQIDYSRPLNEYPTAEKIANFLKSNGNGGQHIYTADLNVNGIAVQDSMEKYLGTDALQSSHLKNALKTPLHLGFSMDDDKKELEAIQGEKAYFKLGEYLHQCILEPTKFGRVIVEPKNSLASKEGVNNLIGFWKSEIEKQGFGIDENDEEIMVEQAYAIAISKVIDAGMDLNKQDGRKEHYRNLMALSGLEAVSEEHYLKIQILKKHYENYGDGLVGDLLKHSKREISFYQKTDDGLDLKVRPDAIQFEENIGVNAIISIKSTACEDLRAFEYHAAKLNYDLSEGMYQDVISKVTGRDFNTTIMIMLQTVAPFGIAVLVWSAEDIEMGKYKFRSGLQIAKESIEKNIFKGYESFADDNNRGMIDMQLPQWNNKELLPSKS